MNSQTWSGSFREGEKILTWYQGIVENVDRPLNQEWTGWCCDKGSASPWSQNPCILREARWVYSWTNLESNKTKTERQKSSVWWQENDKYFKRRLRQRRYWPWGPSDKDSFVILVHRWLSLPIIKHNLIAPVLRKLELNCRINANLNPDTAKDEQSESQLLWLATNPSAIQTFQIVLMHVSCFFLHFIAVHGSFWGLLLFPKTSLAVWPTNEIFHTFSCWPV